MHALLQICTSDRIHVWSNRSLVLGWAIGLWRGIFQNKGACQRRVRATPASFFRMRGSVLDDDLNGNVIERLLRFHQRGLKTCVHWTVQDPKVGMYTGKAKEHLYLTMPVYKFCTNPAFDSSLLLPKPLTWHTLIMVPLLVPRKPTVSLCTESDKIAVTLRPPYTQILVVCIGFTPSMYTFSWKSGFSRLTKLQNVSMSGTIWVKLGTWNKK